MCPCRELAQPRFPVVSEFESHGGPPVHEAANAFSKKLDNLKAALAPHFAWYNFVRVHRSLRVTPTMAAGVSDRVWDLKDLMP